MNSMQSWFFFLSSIEETWYRGHLRNMEAKGNENINLQWIFENIKDELIFF